MKKHRTLWAALALASMASCGPKEEGQAPQSTSTRFELLPPERTGIQFVQQITEEYRYNFSMDPNIFNGGGVAVVDVNNDGLQDLFFTSRLQPCKLYLNKGSAENGYFHFEDVSDQAGLSGFIGIKTGVSVVDVNADGWMDIYVCRTFLSPIPERRNLLFVNNGAGGGAVSFTEKAAEYGLDDLSPTQHAHFFDYDLDGDLDCYLLNHPVAYNQINNIDFVPSADQPWAAMRPPLDGFESDKLLRNEGGRFVDVSLKAGIHNRAWGLSVMSHDFNDDGFPDLYVANDFIMPDFLYINNGDGSFTERCREYFHHTSNHSMGIEIADLTNDGLAEVMTLDMLGETWERRHQQLTTMQLERYKQLLRQGYGDQQMRNTLQLAVGPTATASDAGPRFAEIGCLAGMSATEWGWAPLAADFDNDGWRDLFITNGVRRDLNDIDFFTYTADSINRTGGIGPDRFKDWEDFSKLMPSAKLPNRMFHNQASLQLADVTQDWGLDKPSFSNGAAYADLDNDGDLDLIVHNVDDPPAIYENKAVGNGQHWLQVKLRGDARNPTGTGAKIWVTAGGRLFSGEMSPTHGFYSSVEPIFQVGLGTMAQADEVAVEWPGGKVQVMKGVKADQRIWFDQKAAETGHYPRPGQGGTPLFGPLPKAAALPAGLAHRENEYEDFNAERLLPHRYSRLGPSISVGDLNGDGTEDFFVGGAAGQAGEVFIQKAQGGFERKAQPALHQDAGFEDTGSILFDADGDLDLDLYVVSGGNEAPANDPLYQDRLYRNDGKGLFTRDPAALPAEASSGKAVSSHDLDGDGDLDLLVGGRVSPGIFPALPKSLVLINENGRFKEAAQQLAPDFQYIGMVTDLAWADLDGDKKPELIVAGEWMPLSIFKFDKGRLIPVAHGPSASAGWWNSLCVADLDADGDLDIAAGNLGLNTRFRAPLKLYAKDFDANGSLDPLLCVQENGRFLPVPMRDNLLKQLPFLKKKFVRNTSYAKASIDDLFPQADLSDAQLLQADLLASAWFENRQGQWVVHPLPDVAQVAPLHAMVAEDFTGDGLVDLLLAGNDSGFDVETGPVDTSPGWLLQGDGKGGFAPLPLARSGFLAAGEVRSIKPIQLVGQGKTLWLVANNNGPLTGLVSQH